jgi:hypothetical protein
MALHVSTQAGRSKLACLVRAGPCIATSACSAGPVSVGDNRASATQSDVGDAASPGDGAIAVVDTGGGDIVTQLLGLADPTRCQPATDVLFAAHPGGPADVAICRLSNALFWRSGMDIMCDGQSSPECDVDPTRTGRTVGRDSNGDSLNPATLRYAEVPEPNTRFDYSDSDFGLDMGSPVVVIYENRYQFGVLGDEGAGQLGAGSYRMAADLGINPDPVEGGVRRKEVTYVAFTGFSNRVRPLEDAALAVQTGQALVTELIAAGH